MKDLHKIQRDNLEWEKRIQDNRQKHEAERAKWDPEKIQRAYEMLLSRTDTMTQEALNAGQGDKLEPPKPKATAAILPKLEDLLSVEDYAFLGAIKISLGGPDGSN
jgi:hypothetical protein